MRKVLLEDVLEEINSSAFTTSPYPVILSLEDHLSPEQQAEAAKSMKRILGSALLTSPLAGER